ncbi:MAG: TonB-dependent receptor [Pseudomonadota bacterium]
MKKVFRSRLLASTLLIGSVSLASPALAQVDQGSQDQAAQASEGTSGDESGEVVVTGSRIARPDLEAVSPVTTVGQEQIALTGTTTLETLLNDLPQTIPGVTATSNNPSGPYATLDLRGVGPQRTLILLDGERIAPSSTDGTVDISQIPVGLIQRVDIVTGGASAVYGSDAIGGVINFILRDNFQGAELTAQTSITQQGTGFESNFSGLLGGNFADGKGNVTIYGSYFDRASIGAGRLDQTRVAGATFQAPAASGGAFYFADAPSEVIPGSTLILASASATAPWGSVTNNAANPFQNLAALLPGQFAAANTDCNAATPGVAVNTGTLSFNDNRQLTPFFLNGLCAIPDRASGSSRYNFSPDNYAQLALDRINFSGIGTYELSDRTKLRVYGAYTQSRLEQQLAPTPAGEPATAFVINPQLAQFIPADLRIALNSRPNPTANFRFSRRFNETGPRVGTADNQAFTARAVVEHELSDAFNLSAVLGYGRNNLTTTAVGNINRTAVEQGINGCVATNGLVASATVPQAGVLPNCVPVNIFGANTLTPAMLNFIRTDTVDKSFFEQVRAAVNVAGSLFDLPGGPVGIAVGGEIRTDRGSFTPDDAKRRGEIIGFNAANPTAGQITAREVYGELRLPILGGDGFPDLLAIEGGVRYSDYSTIGGLVNYKIGAEFAPISWIRFRGAYNKAARAPNVNELFQNGDQGFPGFTDPCNSSLTRTPATLALCTAQGVTNLATFQQLNAQTQSFAFGQPDLSEEKAETYTAGVVISPKIPLGRVTATVDYYNINIKGEIQGLGVGFYLAQCFNAVSDPTACARITRDPATGQISAINTGRRNSPDIGGGFVAKGIDGGIDWNFPIADVIGGSSELRFRLSELFSYAIDYGRGGVDQVGSLNGGGISGTSPRYQSTLTAALENDKFTTQLRWVYKSKSCYGDAFGLDLCDYKIDPLSYYDLSARARISDAFELTGIVSNLFGQELDQYDAGAAEQSNVVAGFYTPIFFGRTFTVQARVRF